jgi:hypothetical protein
MADNLAKSVVDLIPPNIDHLSYSIKVMHRPAILNNIKRWQAYA